MKKCKSKSTLYICLLFAASIICCGIALALGATSKENWQKASGNLRQAQGLHFEPVFTSVSLDPTGINDFELEISGDEVVVERHQGNDIVVEYFENYQGEKVAFTKNNELTIERSLSYGSIVQCDSTKNKIVFATGAEWLIYKDYFLITVYLPAWLNFVETEIDISGGSLTANGLTLGKTSIDISGGSLTLTNCNISLLEEIDISGGEAKLKDCSINIIQEIDISGGIVQTENCLINNIKELEVSGGDVVIDSKILLGTTSVKISGGNVKFSNINVAPHNISFNIKTSGGHVYLNGAKVKDSHHSSATAECIFTGRISGGSISVNTN